jgi:hypothetical protein
MRKTEGGSFFWITSYRDSGAVLMAGYAVWFHFAQRASLQGILRPRKSRFHTLESARYGRIWSFAVRRISEAIIPMKSVPCGPNWSFATSLGSWFSGGGIRSASGASGCVDARWSIRHDIEYPGLRLRQSDWVF